MCLSSEYLWAGLFFFLAQRYCDKKLSINSDIRANIKLSSVGYFPENYCSPQVLFFMYQPKHQSSYCSRNIDISQFKVLKVCWLPGSLVSSHLEHIQKLSSIRLKSKHSACFQCQHVSNPSKVFKFQRILCCTQ